MQDAVGNLLANLDRFLRWVYPGLLFIVLLQLGFEGNMNAKFKLDQHSDALQVSGLIVVVIVSSFVIYSLYRYLVHELILYVLFILRRCDVFRYAHQQTGARDHVGWTPWDWWKWSTALQCAEISSATDQDRDYLNYLTFAWAVTHAIGISGWMLLLGVSLADSKSVLREFWEWVVALDIVFTAAWIWQFGKNIHASIGLARRTL